MKYFFLILTITGLSFGCSDRVASINTKTSRLIGSWSYQASKTESRNVGAQLITPWPVTELTFNSDGTLYANTLETDVVKGSWTFDQNQNRYLLQSESPHLNNCYINLRELTAKKLQITYENAVDLYDSEELDEAGIARKQHLNPSYYYQKKK